METPYSRTLRQTAEKYAQLAKTSPHACALTDSLTRLLNAAMLRSHDQQASEPAQACANYFLSLLTQISHRLATGRSQPPSSAQNQAEVEGPSRARSASSLFHLLTAEETAQLDRIVREGPDRAPSWNNQTKHAHMAAMHLAATIPNPFESLALLAESGPDQTEEDSLKAKAQTWSYANNRYNEALPTVVSPNLAKYPDLVDQLLDTDLPPSSSVTGFYTGPEYDPNEDQPATTHLTTVAYTGFILDDRRHYKAIQDPYPRGTPMSLPLEHLSKATQALADRITKEPACMPKQAQEQIQRLIGDMNTIALLSLHQTTADDIRNLTQTALRHGLPQGAATAMLHRLTSDDRLTTILADDPSEKWRQRITTTQARCLAQAAAKCGIDQHTAYHMIEALGQNPYMAGIEIPTLSHSAIQALARDAENLGFPESAIDNMLTPISPDPFLHPEPC